MNPAAAKAFAPLVGLTSLMILVQGVLAGVFLQGDDRDKYSSWISAHNAGSMVAIVLGLLTAVAAYLGFRQRRDVLFGSVGLLVLLVVETVLGHLISGSGHSAVTIVHIPLAMALLALTVWLAARAAQLRSSS